MTAEPFSLKDHLFNAEKVAYLAGLLESGVPGFDADSFTDDVMSSLHDLELKERIASITSVLASHLDEDFIRAAEQIRSALPPPLDPSRTDNDFGDFILAPFGWFVEKRGLDNYETSMTLLRELTMRVSMEGPVRRFIDLDPERTLSLLHEWAEDENYHVRRLVSESTRPLLPWAPRIQLDFRVPLPLLDRLHGDSTRYVTRSVANHLNDISKLDAELAIDALSRWREIGVQTPAELDWINRHALRTLSRRGDARALVFLGYSPEPEAEVGPIVLAKPTISAGDVLEFSLTVSSLVEQRLMIDYVIDFASSNGGVRTKVFKLKKLSMAAGETVAISKRHPLRADASTYRLYPGAHNVTVIVNGTRFSSAGFEVTLG